MLKKFENWFLSTNILKNNSLKYEISKGIETDNNSVYVDVFNDKVYARATLWESKEFQLEAIDSSDDKIFIFEYFKLKEDEEMYQLLKLFIAKISDY